MYGCERIEFSVSVHRLRFTGVGDKRYGLKQMAAFEGHYL